MKIKINTSSMIPIYEQITEEIKKLILRGELKSGDSLPSVRVLANELKISALTVKKAYDRLEEDGTAATVHGKGTYITADNTEMIREGRLDEIETEMHRICEKAMHYGISEEDLREIFEMTLEDEHA